MDQTTNQELTEEKSADGIRADIETTRDGLSQTIDALQEKINPERIKENAKAAALERAQNIAANAKDEALELKDQLGAAPTAQDKIAVARGAVKRHPVVSVLLVLGVLWVLRALLGMREDD